MTVRSFSSVLEAIMASTVGSILVLLSRAMSLSRCRQSGACMCNGGHRVYGSEIIFGIWSCIGTSRVDIAGLLNPMAAIKHIKESIDSLFRKKTYKRHVEDHDQQRG